MIYRSIDRGIGPQQVENQIRAESPVFGAAYENQATQSKTKIIGVIYIP